MTATTLLDKPFLLALLLPALLGGLLLLSDLRGFSHRRWLRSLGGVCSGGGLLALAALAASIGLNFYTYQRLTYEQEVATLRFRQIAPQRYLVDLTTADRPTQRHELRGDAWQLDARVLKWRGTANLLGLDARYRLERLSGRYQNIDQERQAARTVHGLADNKGIDLFALVRDYPRWTPWLDTDFGSAAYLPMADGAEYRVSLTQSGLIARPTNATARTAVQRWR
ncbi:MAG TPA: hypothetical protein VFY81_14630 [Gammaproteobacteria bacterium]|nr:hypothetical protein [Gammaproteobacteria bacterium]